jgi:DNA primase
MIGRALGQDERRTKYLALRGERPILGYERAAGRRAVFLCEGVFDYLTAVVWRLPAFSPCGSHLPPAQLGFLARAEVVYGVFDADEAGAQAAERMAELLGSRWRPLRLPTGCDLNDLGRRRDGRAVFYDLLAEARAARKPEGNDAT